MKEYRGLEAIAFLSGTFFDREASVVCPNCQSGYTHVHHAGTLVGSDEHEAVLAFDGTTPSGTTPSRRSAAEIVFTCENCPQRFALVIQPYKGVCFVKIHQDVDGGVSDCQP